ncbi:hypothetical protein CRYUN_Cryun18bG0103200 [Craigia yunnanensis]
MQSSQGEPVVLELCSKILTRTDVGVRLSFPTATMREHFRLEEGTQSQDFQVTDTIGRSGPFASTLGRMIVIQSLSSLADGLTL